MVLFNAKFTSATYHLDLGSTVSKFTTTLLDLGRSLTSKSASSGMEIEWDEFSQTLPINALPTFLILDSWIPDHRFEFNIPKHKMQRRTFVILNFDKSDLAVEQFPQKTPPQSRQWCRRVKKPYSVEQRVQFEKASSFAHSGKVAVRTGEAIIEAMAHWERSIKNTESISFLSPEDIEGGHGKI